MSLTRNRIGFDIVAITLGIPTLVGVGQVAISQGLSTYASPLPADDETDRMRAMGRFWPINVILPSMPKWFMTIGLKLAAS